MLRSPRLALFVRAFWVALIPGALLFAWMQMRGYAAAGMIGCDSHAYWLAAREPQTWYTRPAATWDAYLYSPAFAQAMWLPARLPWPAFQMLWLVGQVAVAVWLMRPLGWRKTLTLLPFLTGELLLGNLYVFFGAVLVLAVRGRSAALAVPLLTKVTPAVVGLWLVLQRRWRDVMSAAVVTLLVIAVSAAVDYRAWVRWVEVLVDSGGTDRGHATVVRLALSLVLVVVAARTDRSVLLAPALILACPVLGGWNYLAVLVALPRLHRRDCDVRQTSPEGEAGRTRRPDRRASTPPPVAELTPAGPAR